MVPYHWPPGPLHIPCKIYSMGHASILTISSSRISDMALASILQNCKWSLLAKINHRIKQISTTSHCENIRHIERLQICQVESTFRISPAQMVISRIFKRSSPNGDFADIQKSKISSWSFTFYIRCHLIWLRGQSSCWWWQQTKSKISSWLFTFYIRCHLIWLRGHSTCWWWQQTKSKISSWLFTFLSVAILIWLRLVVLLLLVTA